MPSITVRQRFNQPVEQVFAAFNTHAKLNALFWPLQVVRVKDAADSHNPDGVGSVRRMGFGLLKPVAEKITAYQANQLIEYTLVGAAPVRNHLGRMTFTADGHGSFVDYYIELDSPIPLVAPATLMGLQLALRTGLARMARTFK